MAGKILSVKSFGKLIPKGTWHIYLAELFSPGGYERIPQTILIFIRVFIKAGLKSFADRRASECNLDLKKGLSQITNSSKMESGIPLSLSSIEK